MHGVRCNDSVPSLPPPRPKSPPEYPDLYGKRRELAKIQVLEREIGFLEEEVKSAEGLQPASRSCKAVVDFVTCNADPLVPIGKKIRRSHCFWNWLCGLSCFNVSWICCCCCSSNFEKPRCCDCSLCSCSNPCVSVRMPECSSSFCWNSQCFNKFKCSWNCCTPNCLSCFTCYSIRCSRCYPKCVKVNKCSCCKKHCCYPCCFCY